MSTSKCCRLRGLSPNRTIIIFLLLIALISIPASRIKAQEKVTSVPTLDSAKTAVPSASSADQKKVADDEDDDDDDDEPQANHPAAKTEPSKVSASASGGKGGERKTSIRDDAANPDKRIGPAATKDDDDDDDDDNNGKGAQSVSASKSLASSKEVAAAKDDEDDDDDDDDDDNETPTVSALSTLASPGLETRFDYYRDSEGNVTRSTTTVASALFADSLLQLRETAISARDASGTQFAESKLASAYRSLSRQIAIGGGLGVVRTQNWSTLAGSLVAAANFGDASLLMSVVRGMVGGTATAIRDHLMQTDMGINLSNDFTSNISAELSFHRRMFNDGNNSNDFVFSPQYEFVLDSSKLNLGYNLTYQSFARSAAHGYYSPRSLLANGLTTIWKFDRPGFYGNVESSAGYANIRGTSNGDGATTSGICGSVTSTLGFRPREDTLVETYWSGEWATGWNSTAIGVRVRYDF